MAVVVAVVILDDADDGHFLKQFLQARRREVLIHGHELFEGVELSELHAVADLHVLGGEDLLQAPVLGIVRADAADHVLRDVRDLLREFRVFLVEIRFTLILGDDVFVLFRHGDTPLQALCDAVRLKRIIHLQ